MAQLTAAHAGVRESFLAAMAEFAAEGRGAGADDSVIGRELREHGGQWHTTAGFARFVTALRGQARGENLPAGYVPVTTLWWTDGADYLGRIAIWHRLTGHRLQAGRHIGYDMRPSARRRGHATAMLAAALPRAQCLGISPALITCDTASIASRKVIEHCGGVLEDERGGKLRLWVPAGP